MEFGSMQWVYILELGQPKHYSCIDLVLIGWVVVENIFSDIFLNMSYFLIRQKSTKKCKIYEKI